MTPRARQAKKFELEDVRHAIRETGLRATPARLAILSALWQATSPLTHATLAESLCDSGIDKATVFRGLNDLTGAGLLRRTEVGDHVWRFEAVDLQADHDDAHPHFLCVDCGTVTCLEDVKLTQGSLRHSEQYGDITEILLRGHCNECR